MTTNEFAYPCPDCGSLHHFHYVDCEWDELSRADIEEAYTRIVSAFIAEHVARQLHGMNPRISFGKLRRRVSTEMETGLWRSEHTACLHALKRHRLVDEDDDGLRLISPDAFEHEVIPQFDPMKTVYEYGPVDGCKDYAVFAMVSWCEMVELSWEQTVEFMRDWLTETGAWERESWAESSIDELLASKRHVYEKGLGWKNRAENAKRIIDAGDHEQRVDAAAKQREYAEESADAS